MLIQEPVQAAIWHCLDHYDYFDAIFLAERLNAEVESDESTFLLATCYYRAGKPNQAYSLLRRKGCITPQCKFLLAKCCLEFENLSEAETILRGSSSSDEEVHSEQLNIENIVSEYGEHAVFVLRLLSEICYQTERDKVANELNRKILKLNPFIWSSFEMLCNRTELPPPVNPKPSMNHTLSTPLMTNHSVQQNLSTPANNTTDKTDKQLPPIPPCLDPATLFNINQLDNFMYCHSSSAPGVYSCAGAPTAPSGGAPVPQTPMNQASEPPLMGQQLPPDSPLINCTPVQHLNNINTNNHSGSGGGKQFTPDDTAQFKPAPPRVGKQYRTRSGLHTIMSPLNASPNPSVIRQDLSGVSYLSSSTPKDIPDRDGLVTPESQHSLGIPGARTLATPDSQSLVSPGSQNSFVIPRPQSCVNPGTQSLVTPGSQQGLVGARSWVTPGGHSLSTPSPSFGTPGSLNLMYINTNRTVFGILPLDSSNSFSDTPPPPPYSSSPSPLIINSSGNLPPVTLTDSNEQKPIVKRQIMSKRASNTTPLHGNSQSPQSPLPLPPLPLQGSQNTVRRSSRLFTISNNNYSVKENNKSPNRNNKFATPKSPSKKTKSKLSKSSNGKPVVTYDNERNLSSGGGGGGETDQSIAGGVMSAGGYSREQMLSVQKHVAMVEVGRRTRVSRGGVMSAGGYSREQMLSVQKHVASGLLDLLKELGRAYYYFSQYECDKCIAVLNTLPEHHLNTGFSLTLMAKAYYESSRYKEAIKCFAKVRELEPKRTQGLELYSTALWQQQQEVELSALAQDMNRVDQFCPQTWCVNGNCFSAQKEHDTAIKYFQRATQVDPNFAYAYTLLGHEYVLTEELDKAMNCYRHAVRIDPRHYNAWYGIGSIYSKQERFLLAEIHFRKALKINPNSSVLMCHIGVAQNALGKIDAALYTFNLALEKDPKNPLCKFHRASILFGTGRHAEALQELEELKDIVPKESLVYYLAGKVHKKLGNTHLALMHFSWATDLDPKGANSQIKEAIDPAMNRSATTSDLHLEEEMRDDLDTTDNQDNLFASSPPPSSSSARGSGGITPANTTPANNNNNVSTNSGLSSGFRRDELGEELDDDLDDISGTEVLHSSSQVLHSSRDMALEDSDDTL
ncbi:hypothetical protein M8J77_021531 [Diaphorina citri]|nr:hypothetical protein M8J77_021531 [Diaphorina citri]